MPDLPDGTATITLDAASAEGLRAVVAAHNAKRVEMAEVESRVQAVVEALTRRNGADPDKSTFRLVDLAKGIIAITPHPVDGPPAPLTVLPEAPEEATA